MNGLLKNETFVTSLQQSIGEKQVDAGTMYRALRKALFESINDASLILMKKTFDLFIQEGIIKRICVYDNQCKYTISLPSIDSTFEEHSDSYMSLEQNTRYVNVHKLLEIALNEENKSLKESIENIFKNHMYQKDIETICECLLNQRTYIIKLNDNIKEASRQLNERIVDVRERNNYIRSLESKYVIKDIVFIFLILLSIFSLIL